jgi:hypothetical protein
MIASRSRLASLAFAAALAWSIPAVAQTPNERALAESLFREGKDLMAKGDYASACRKLEESYRLDGVGGTLLNLATCHEKEGKVATAWAEYQSALELAKRANRRDRVALAQKKVDELAKLVAKITIQVSGEPLAGLVVELDGVALGAGSMGTALAIDPGEHRVVARAEGHASFESKITVTAGESTTLAIPALAKKEEPKPPPPPPPPEETATWMRPTSYVLGGVAVVGLIVGTGAGIAALGEASDAEAGCEGGLCSQAGLDAHESGRTAATISNVGFVVGLVAGAGAATLFVLSIDEADEDVPADAAARGSTPGRSRRDVAAIAPYAGPTAVGATMRMRWR